MDNPTDKAPREWWIHEWVDSQPSGFLSGNIEQTKVTDVFDTPEIGAIRVIEYSAFEDIKTESAMNFERFASTHQELERVKAQLDDRINNIWELEKAVEILVAERDALRAKAQAYEAALESVEEMGNDSTVVCRKCGDEETLQDSDFIFVVREALAKHKGSDAK